MKDALIICTKSRSGQIDRWLNELESIVQGPDLIVIVDSNKSRRTLEIVKNHVMSTKLKIDYVPSQSGLPLQRNNGIDYLIESYQGDLPLVVHFLDDDVSVRSDYFFTVNQLFEENPDAIAIGGFDKNLDGKISNGFWRRSFLLGSRNNGVVLKSGVCIPPIPQSRAEHVEWLPGLSQSIRINTFSKIRFDSEIYFYGEDIDFYLRLQKFGNIICSKDLPVDHLHEQTDRDGLSTSIMESDMSRWALAHKYPHVISRWSVVFSTAVLVVGEFMLGVFCKGKSHFSISFGHMWFLVNALNKKIE